MTCRPPSIMLTIDLRMGYHILSIHSNLFPTCLFGLPSWTATNRIPLKYRCPIKINSWIRCVYLKLCLHLVIDFFWERILDVSTNCGLHFICNHGTSCRSCLVVLCIQRMFTCFYLVFLFYRILIFLLLTKVYASPNLLLTGFGRAKSWIHKDQLVPNVRCHFENIFLRAPL